MEFARIKCGLLLLLFSLSLHAQVYHVDISGTIDLGLPTYLERVISEAEAGGASALLLEVNTFGGRVDAATQIKDLLLNTNLPTYAYVNKRAISAGALISLSCKTIGMTPGSSIGAATVVDGSGTKQSEKAQSYFRAEMGATAERNGRNRQIAEGMVDEDVEVEGLSEKGKLITLTAEDAIKYRMADYVAPTLSAFLDSVGLGDQQVVNVETTWAENVVRFLTGPVISSILMMMIFMGIFFELQSPGWGVAGSMAIVGLALFFGSHYIVNLAESWEIVLFLLGLVLLFVELFVLPGFGIAGVLGIAFIIAGSYLSLIGAFDTVGSVELGAAATRVSIALLVSIGMMILLWKLGMRTSLWDNIAIKDEQLRSEGYVSQEDYSRYIGKDGLSSTPLRPSGTGIIDGRRLDLVSEGDFIEANEAITVVNAEGYRLVVRRKLPPA